jgi:hypothetical protein
MAMTINASRSTLITTLSDNKNRHVEEFQEAMLGWRKQIAEIFDNIAQEARDGKLTKIPSKAWRHDVPQSHIKDYECAIAMLGMHTGDTVEISTADFQRFVQDDWDWKDQFRATNAMYSQPG